MLHYLPIIYVERGKVCILSLEGATVEHLPGVCASGCEEVRGQWSGVDEGDDWLSGTVEEDLTE